MTATEPPVADRAWTYRSWALAAAIAVDAVGAIVLHETGHDALFAAAILTLLAFGAALVAALGKADGTRDTVPDYLVGQYTDRADVEVSR